MGIATAHEVVWIKIIHGKFVFSLQKHRFNARETNYLSLTNQLPEGYVSSRLPEFCAYYSNRIVALVINK
jgi:hypothetical protein